MNGLKKWIGCTGLAIFLSVPSLSRGQNVYYLNQGGSLGAADSTPTQSNFEAVFQQSSADMPLLTTTDPASPGPSTPDGDEAFLGTNSSLDNGKGLLGFYYYAGGGSAEYYGSDVYDTNGTAGSNQSSDPLDLGTSSATPNTFSLATNQTMTYSVDFANNYHGTDLVDLFNPKATDAGGTNATNNTSGGYLGVGLKIGFASTTSTYAVSK